MTVALLTVTGMRVRYGVAQALFDVSFDVQSGSVLRVRACAADLHSVGFPFSALRRPVLTKFHAKSQNKVDNVTRSVSMSRYEKRYREGSHRAGNS